MKNERVVLPPRDRRWRSVLAKVLLPLRVGADGGLDVVEHVEHDLIAARHVEVPLVQLPQVRVDRLRIGDPGQVLRPVPSSVRNDRAAGSAAVRSCQYRMPSRQALAEEYGYTHMTVARALNILKDEGLIYGVPGLGVFVR